MYVAWADYGNDDLTAHTAICQKQHGQSHCMTHFGRLRSEESNAKHSDFAKIVLDLESNVTVGRS